MKNVLTLLGFFVAIVMAIGALQKSNYRLVKDGQTTTNTSFAAASLGDDDESAPANGSRISLDETDNPANDPFDPPAMDGTRRVGSSSGSGSSRQTAASSSEDVSEWITSHGPIAVMEALRQGVPAGLSLAVGVLQLQQGELRWNDNFANKVVGALASRKDEAPARFKYKANSEPWIQGLAELGVFNRSDLMRVFNQYKLAAYDAEVYLALQDDDRKQSSQPRIAQAAIGAFRPESERATRGSASAEVADESLRRNVSNAMNRYAERELSERGKSARVVAAAPAASAEASSARRKMERLSVGKSMEFDSPREFQLALQELLALEEGYPSWAAYQQDEAAEARRNFNRRSDVMAAGGRMRVTRRK